MNKLHRLSELEKQRDSILYHMRNLYVNGTTPMMDLEGKMHLQWNNETARAAHIDAMEALFDVQKQLMEYKHEEYKTTERSTEN